MFHLKEGDKATFAPSVFFDRLAKVISKQKIAKQPKAKTSKDKSNKASVKATKEEPKTEPKTTKGSPSLLDIKNAVELYNKNTSKAIRFQTLTSYLLVFKRQSIKTRLPNGSLFFIFFALFLFCFEFMVEFANQEQAIMVITIYIYIYSNKKVI